MSQAESVDLHPRVRKVLQEGQFGLGAPVARLLSEGYEVCGGVGQDGFDEEVCRLDRERLEEARGDSRVRVEEVEGLVADHEGEDHLVLGERAGLVAADGVCSAHGFAGVQLADQVVLSEHLFDGVGQRERHGQRQAFGDGHDDHGDLVSGDYRHDDCADDAGRVLALVPVLSPGPDSQQQSQQQREQREHCEEEPEPADLVRQVFQFELQRGFW